MNFDARTFLFSTSIVMALLAIIIISSRKGLGWSIKGLGSFATANLLGTAAAILIGLRGTVPFEISYIFGNSLLLCGVAYYIVAIRGLDGKKTSGRFVPIFTTSVLFFIVLASFFNNNYTSMVVVTGPLGLVALYCAWHLKKFAPHDEEHSFPRRFCMFGFFGLGLVSVFRVLATPFDPLAGLFSNSFTGTPIYIISAIMSLFITMGFIMTINERVQSRLLYLATHDPLTGALNRLAFMNEAELFLAMGRASGQTTSIAMVDLDHFKRINDAHGHEAGDKVLVRFVIAAKKTLGNEAILGRYGGEEFVIAIANCDKQRAKNIAERLRLACMTIPVADGMDRCISASVGVAIESTHEESIASIIKRADQALYHAKSNGRNQVQLAA